MKVLLLADINSSHTQKWVNALLDNKIEVQIFSLNPPKSEDIMSSVTVTSFFKKHNSSSLKEKAMYVFATKKLKSVITHFNPDYVHAHYASSYGIIGRMSKFKPLYISVWGSDVFDFPRQNKIFKSILTKNLNAAQHVFSSSRIMAEETRKYTTTPIEVIPFGINLDQFIPKDKPSKDTITLGIIKSLEPIYAIDSVLKAMAILKDLNLELNIVGTGSKDQEYRMLAQELGIASKVHFKGRVTHSDIMKEYQALDIFVNVSHRESFGVSILEASACEKPIIAHKVGGMIEVVKHNETGILIENNSAQAIADAIIDLVNHPSKRKEMGIAGRIFVKQHFDWNQNVKKMISYYS